MYISIVKQTIKLLFLSSVQSFGHVWLFVTPWMQHARPPCPSLTPRACSNLCSLSRWCYLTTSSSVVLFSSSLSSILPSIRVSSSESVLHIRWPKYWNFSISPSNEYSGLISFWIGWFDLDFLYRLIKFFICIEVSSRKIPTPAFDIFFENLYTSFLLLKLLLLNSGIHCIMWERKISTWLTHIFSQFFQHHLLITNYFSIYFLIPLFMKLYLLLFQSLEYFITLIYLWTFF